MRRISAVTNGCHRGRRRSSCRCGRRAATSSRVAGRPHSSAMLPRADLPAGRTDAAILEKRFVVIADAVADFVDHRQPVRAQHVVRHSVSTAQRSARSVVFRFFRRQRHAVAFVEQAGNFTLALQDALVADFSRCAVSTGDTSAMSGPCRTVCGAMPAALIRSSACVRLPSRGFEPARSWARRRRMWCWSSAMLARCRK